MLERLDTRPNRLVFALTVFFVFPFGALMLYSSDDGATALAAEEEKKPPDYRVLDVFDAPEMREVAVATPERGEREMRLIAEALEEKNTPEDGTLLVEYYRTSDPSRNTGFALVFDGEEAVLDAGRTQRFGEVYDEEDAERIVEEEGGIRVVSFEKYAQENPSVWKQIKEFLF